MPILLICLYFLYAFTSYMPILLICLYFLYAYTSEKTTLHFRTLLLYNNPKTHISKEGLFQILKGLISEYVQCKQT